MKETKNRKWNPQYWIGLLKVSPKVQRVWNTPFKTKHNHWEDANHTRGRVKTLWEEKPPHQQPREGPRWQTQD